MARTGLRGGRRNAVLNVVLAADEMPIRFHEDSSHVVALIGDNRVGRAATYDEKAGRTLLPTINMLSSKLITPLLTFNGILDAKLMKNGCHYREVLCYLLKMIG